MSIAKSRAAHYFALGFCPCVIQSAAKNPGSFTRPAFSTNSLHCRCQLAPPSEVAKLCPPVVVIMASFALLADTAARFSAVGAVISSQCSPSVVRMIVPLRPTIQHTVADGADPAARSVLTPLCCVRVAPSASCRCTKPSLPAIHVTDPPGVEMVTSIRADDAVSFRLSAVPPPATAPDPAPTAAERGANALPYASAPAFGAAAPVIAENALAPGAGSSLCNACEEYALIASPRAADSVFASFIAITFEADAAGAEAAAAGGDAGAAGGAVAGAGLDKYIPRTSRRAIALRASFIASTLAAAAGAGAGGAACGGDAGASCSADSACGASFFAIATSSSLCDSSFAGRLIAMKTRTAATAASAGIATRHLRYHGISDAALAARALSSARAISANISWHRMQSAKCVSRRSRSVAASDRSLYAASDSASAHSGVAGPGCARIARRRIGSSGSLFLLSGVTSSQFLIL